MTERAPVLSATSSTVCIWIISSSPTCPARGSRRGERSVLEPVRAETPAACDGRGEKAGDYNGLCSASASVSLDAGHGGDRLDGLRPLEELRHAPVLRPGDRTALLDRHEIAFLALVRLVVRVVLLRAHDDLAVERVRDPALDEDGHRLVHLVAYHPPRELAPALLGGLVLGHFALAFSASRVRTRAMSRRTFFSWLVFGSCCVAFCMRRLNCALRRSCSSLVSAPASLARSSLAFIRHPSCRWTNVVRIGSFAAARANASRASASLTPSISSSTFPGWISATKYSGFPLPLPIRTSAGFWLTGLSGKMRIQMRPPRFTWRVIARLPASIWRAVSRPRVVAFRPHSPKLTFVPRVATP